MTATHVWTKDDYRVLTADELLPLLEKYFIPPITDVHAAWLHQRLAEIVRDPPRWGGERAAYEGIRKYFGTAWQCELSLGMRSPRTVDLAMFIACRTTGFPAPKLHCPPPFCGTWREVEGLAPGSLWHLAPTGAAKVVGAELSTQRSTKWYVGPRQQGTFDLSVLFVDSGNDNWGPGHIILNFAPTDFTMTSHVFRKPRAQRRLEKVSDDPGIPLVWETVPR